MALHVPYFGLQAFDNLEVYIKNMLDMDEKMQLCPIFQQYYMGEGPPLASKMIKTDE